MFSFLVYQLQNDFQKHSTRSTHMAISAELVPHFVLGLNMIASDLLWLKAIQDFRFKDAEHTEKGWVFQMLDASTNLDPRFKIIYELGTIALSVLIGDTPGASILFEKGISNFPHDWSINYRAGYHFLYEVKDCNKAAQLFKRAADNGAPPWLNAMAARLYNMTGQYDLARTILNDTLKNFKGEIEYKQRIQFRLDQLEEARRTGRTSDFADCSSFLKGIEDTKKQKRSM